MDIKLAAAYWSLESLASEELPAIALGALEQGLDSPSLRALAVMRAPAMSEAGPLFHSCLAELDIDIPPQAAAAIAIARHHAHTIIKGRITPYEGAKRIVDEAAYFCEFDELKLLMGLVDEYADFRDDVHVDFYGEAYCQKVRESIERAILATAKDLIRR